MAESTATLPVSTVISNLYEGLAGQKKDKDAAQELQQFAGAIKDAAKSTPIQQRLEAKLLLVIAHHWHRIKRSL